MDKRTLAALRGSIEKWRAIEEGRGVDMGCLNCPLCQEFRFRSYDYVGCDGCPVDDRTNGDACDGTPYEAFSEWDHRRRADDVPLNPRVHTKGVRLARAEREFLESLLPDGEKP